MMKGDQPQVTFSRSQQPNVSWISVIKGQRRMGGTNAYAETKIIRRVKRSEDQLNDELLEGIPNETTLIRIAAKLPYRAWQIARSLSPDWQRAFEGGMVYDARIRSQATETFIAVLCNYSKRYRYPRRSSMKKRTLSLFSPNEERWYKLPPIPGFPGGMPTNRYCLFAALDSSIYVLGGTRSGEDFPTAEVFVLDLAIPPLEWRRCADMQIQRRNFRVGVLHGRIFVFGGVYDDFSNECSNEAYDPKLDAWSWIAPIKPPGSGHESYSVEQTWSVGQHFVCLARAGRSSPESNRVEARASDYTSSSSMKRLFVQTGARGPFLRSLSPNHRLAEDQMDDLHEMIANQRFVKDGRVRLTDKFEVISPAADRLQYILRDEELEPHPAHLIWTYDPLKDDWGGYDTLDVDINTVDSWDYPKDMRELPLPLQPADCVSCTHVNTQVWTMSF